MGRTMYARRACDRCRRRKVKCDGTEECFNCRNSSEVCGYTVPPRKRGRAVEKRPLAAGHEAQARSREYEREDLLHGLQAPMQPQDIGRRGSGTPTSASDNNILASAASPFAAHQSSQIPLSHGHSPAVSSQVSFVLGPAESLQLGGHCYAVHDATLNPATISASLLDHLGKLLPQTCLQDVAHRCIDLWATYLFPMAPFGHEQTLRASVTTLGPDAHGLEYSSPMGPPTSPLNSRYSHPHLEFVKRFALITSLCALIASSAQEALLPERNILALPMLQASRAMLLSVESVELEHPDATSIITRAWHASAMQNTIGKQGAARQTHLGAELLALRLRLYDEASLTRSESLEAQQLRSVFWVLYLSDKASLVLNSRIGVCTEKHFEGSLTVAECGDLESVPHLDPAGKFGQPPLDSYVWAAFHWKRRMWAMCAELVTAVREFPTLPAVSSPISTRSVSAVEGATPSGCVSELPDIDALTEMYLNYTGLTDTFPPWLRAPGQPIAAHGAVNAEAEQHQKTCCWVMRSNMMTTFYCLKLIILQECVVRSLHRLLGIDASDIAVGMRKLDIASDFLYELQIVPFEVYKMQGEPVVDRLRQVGSILLELVQNTTNHVVEARGRTQFRQLLDYLSQLDSRVSDELGEGANAG